jgi:Ca-activated chloride channel family protein
MSTRPSQRISIDDPRLTAFALGELEGSERDEIERLLESSPECRQLVAELQELAGQLTQELQSESGEGLTPAAREAIAAASQPPAAAVASPRPHRLRRWVLICGGLASCTAAAVWAVMLATPGEDSALVAYVDPAVANEGLNVSYSGFGEAAPQSRPRSARSDKVHDEPEQLAQVALGLTDLGGAEAKDWAFRNGNGVDPSNAQKPETEPLLHGRVLAQNGQVSGGGTSSVRWKDDAEGRLYGVNEDAIALPRAPLADDETRQKHDLYVTRELNGKPAAAGQPPTTFYADTGKQVDGLMRGGRPGVQPPTATLATAQPATQLHASVDQPPADRRYLSYEYRVQQRVEGLESESYQPIVENGFVSPTAQPLSTFSIDVDTASYANVRRFLTHNTVPPPAAVRLEELINYFRYDDPQPADGVPFSVNCEVGACPWQVDHRLVRIGLKGREITREQRPATNLVFLVDVSGSMAADNKLPLVKSSLQLLTEELDESDRIAIVTYAGTSGVLLDSITGDHRQTIMNAIGSLQSGGSTNGASGIQLAYTTAVNHFIEGGSNRVILCTDGDFNVGVTDDDQLVQLIQSKAKTGVFLSVFGFGMGNLKDSKLEKLADKGNGNYGYIDSLREAQKTFVEDLFGTLVTIAKDVKIQVEFNPAQVDSYRLLGYENRVMATRDFRDDTKDAGEIGAGHSVTALYEFVPANGRQTAPGGEKLKYQPQAAGAGGDVSPELLTVKLRYKQPTADTSTEFSQALVDPHNARPSQNLQWASAVTAFGLTLRQSAHRGQASFALAKELAQGAVGTDKAGHRHEFIGLIDRAAQIVPTVPAVPTVPTTKPQPVDPLQERD